MTISVGALTKPGKELLPGNVNESALVEEQNKLSAHERLRISEEIHGVAEVVKETPELVQKCLSDLRQVLSKMSYRKRKTLDRAFFLKPSLAVDGKFQLMFLRAEGYDPVKAAARMCLFFDYKLELFGEDKLVSKITLDDLNEDDMEVMQTGAIRALPNKDQAGRTVLFTNHPAIQFKNCHSMLRYAFYQVMALLEDEEVQIHGVVEILNFVGMNEFPNKLLDFSLQAMKMLPNFPVRRCGWHIFYDDAQLQPAMVFYKAIFGKDIRLRGRTHFGSELEMRFVMMSFGVELGSFMDILQGPSATKSIEAYIQRRRQSEGQWRFEEYEKETFSACIAYPQPSDVLVGRGRPYQDHSGSALLGDVVNAYLDRFVVAHERSEKTVIATEIMQLIQQQGGRFLQRTEIGWQHVDVLVARQKIIKALRYALKLRSGPFSSKRPLPEDELQGSFGPPCKKVRC